MPGASSRVKDRCMANAFDVIVFFKSTPAATRC
jgi:hypothetical protein